jgi:hypothetical protein
MYHFYKDLSNLDPVVVAQLYITSSHLIELLDTFESNGIPLRSCPVYYSFALLLSITTMARILKTSLSRHLDKKTGEAVYFRGISILEKLSVEPDDISSRLSMVMRRLWGDPTAYQTPEGKDITHLRVRSRLSTSAAYDTLTTQIRKGQLAHSETVNYTLLIVIIQQIVLAKSGHSPIARKIQPPPILLRRLLTRVSTTPSWDKRSISTSTSMTTSCCFPK